MEKKKKQRVVLERIVLKMVGRSELHFANVTEKQKFQ